MEYTTGEVAKIIKVTKQTLYNWLRNKKIPEPKRNMNRYRRWTNQDLRNALDYKDKRI